MTINPPVQLNKLEISRALEALGERVSASVSFEKPLD